MLANEPYRSLRSGALAALNSDGAGVNPLIHFGLIEDSATDPLYWAILTTLRTVRCCGEPEVVKAHLARVARADFQGPSNTISKTLLSRIQKLGWLVTPAGLVTDTFGTFDLTLVGLAELTLRASLAWPSYVATQLQHRPALRGLAHAHVARTRKWLRTLSVPCRAAFVKVLNGAHITQDGKQHCDAQGSSLCPWCESSDSRFHRFWICPHFHQRRSSFPSKFHSALPALPESLTCYGWSARPHTLRAWLSYFALASMDPQQCNPQWTQAGPLPGIIQSAYRAETFAVLQALEFAAVVQLPLHLWSDCGAVVAQVRALLQGKQVSANHAHADLWSRISHLLQRIPQVLITRVSAHENPAQAPDALHMWCYHNNARADALAVDANTHRGPAFEHLLAAHRFAVDTMHELSRAIQHVQLQISLAVLQEQDTQKAADDPGQASDDPQSALPVPTWEPLPQLDWVPSAAIRWYGETQVRRIQSWFWSALQPGQLGPVQWISHFQLYVDYQKSTGNFGPIHNKGWCDSQDRPDDLLVDRPFKLRCRWFIKVWKEIMRHRGIALSYNFTRPVSLYLNLHCGCVAVPWPVARLQAIDTWFQRHLVATASRDGRSLQTLPVCQQDPAFEPVALTDAPVH